MSGAIPPLPQYASMAWYTVKAQVQLTFTTVYAVEYGFHHIYLTI